MGNQATMLIWCDDRQAGRLGQILAKAQQAVRPVCIGGVRHSQVEQLARDLSCPFGDDLRQLLVDHPARILLLAGMNGVNPADVATALGNDMQVWAMDPPITSFDDLALLYPAAAQTNRVFLTPAFYRSDGWIAAADPLQVLGQTRQIRFSSLGQPGDCSLFTRLFDAWRMVLGVLGLPESITASLSQPAGLPVSQMRTMAGHLAVQARWSHATGLLQLSDMAGMTYRHLEVIGDDAHLWVCDGHYSLHSRSGKLLDGQADAMGQPAPFFEQLVIDDWLHLLSAHDAGTPFATLLPPAYQDDAAALACCLATHLSARTQQPEHPATVLKLQMTA